MTNCLLIFVVLSLIGLGLGDSTLVTLSLCSLVLSFVISSLLFSVCFLVFFFFFLFLSLYSLPYLMFSWGSFLNIHLSYLSKKKLLASKGSSTMFLGLEENPED